MSFKLKLIISFLFFGVLPLIILRIVGGIALEQYLKVKSSEFMLETSEVFKSKLESKLNSAAETIQNLQNFDNFKEISHYESGGIEDEYKNQYNLSTFLEVFDTQNDLFEEIIVFKYFEAENPKSIICASSSKRRRKEFGKKLPADEVFNVTQKKIVLKDAFQLNKIEAFKSKLFNDRKMLGIGNLFDVKAGVGITITVAVVGFFSLADFQNYVKEIGIAGTGQDENRFCVVQSAKGKVIFKPDINYEEENYISNNIDIDNFNWTISIFYSKKLAFEEISSFNLMLNLLLLFMAILAVFGALYLSSKFAEPITRELVENNIELKKVVDELELRITTRTNELEDVINQAAQTASTLNESITELNSFVQNQKSDSEHQQNRIADMMEMMSNLVDKGKTVLESSEKVADQAKLSLNNFSTLKSQTGELFEIVESISEIIELIHNFSRRSEILALNAAIEGAKAGEIGDGFTIVAREMRVFSEEITKSTDKIKKHINLIAVSAKDAYKSVQIGAQLEETNLELALSIKNQNESHFIQTNEMNTELLEMTRSLNKTLFMVSELEVSVKELNQMATSLVDVINTNKRYT